MAQPVTPSNAEEIRDFLSCFFDDDELDHVLIAPSSRAALKKHESRPGLFNYTAREFLYLLENKPQRLRFDTAYWVQASTYCQNPGYPAPGEYKFSAKKAYAQRVRVLLLDDIGAKYPESGVPQALLDACGRVETSEGSYHYAVPIDLSVEEFDMVAKWVKGQRPLISDPGAVTVTRWVRIPFGIHGKFYDGERNQFRCRLDKMPGYLVELDTLRDLFAENMSDTDITRELSRQRTIRLGGNTDHLPTFSPTLQLLSDHELLVELPNVDGWAKGLCPYGHQHSEGDGTFGYNVKTGQVHCFHGHSNVAEGAVQGSDELIQAYVRALTPIVPGPESFIANPKKLAKAIKKLPGAVAASDVRKYCTARVLRYDETPADATEQYKALLRQGGVAEDHRLMVMAGEHLRNQLMKVAATPDDPISDRDLKALVPRGTATFSTKWTHVAVDITGAEVINQVSKDAQDAKEAARKAENEAENTRRKAEYAATEAKRKAEIDAENTRRMAEYDAKEAAVKEAKAAENAKRLAAYEAKEAEVKAGIDAENAKRLAEYEIRNAERKGKTTAKPRKLKYKPRLKPKRVAYKPTAKPQKLKYKPRVPPSLLKYTPLVATGDPEPEWVPEILISQPRAYAQLASSDWVEAGVLFDQAIIELKLVDLWTPYIEDKLRPIYLAKADTGQFTVTDATQITELSASIFVGHRLLALKAQTGLGKTEEIVAYCKSINATMAYISPLAELSRAGAARLGVAFYKDGGTIGTDGVSLCCASLHREDLRKAVLACDVVVFDEASSIFETLYSAEMQNARINNLALSEAWVRELLRGNLTNNQQYFFLDADLDDFTVAQLRELSGAPVTVLELPEYWGERKVHGKPVPQKTAIVADWENWRDSLNVEEGPVLFLADDIALVDRWGREGRYSRHNKAPPGFGTQYCLDIEAENKAAFRPPPIISSTPVLGRGIDLHTKWRMYCAFKGRISADGCYQLDNREREPFEGRSTLYFTKATDNRKRQKLDAHLAVFNDGFPEVSDDYTDKVLEYTERADNLRVFGGAGYVDRLAKAEAKIIYKMLTLPSCRGAVVDLDGMTEEEARREGVLKRLDAMAELMPVPKDAPEDVDNIPPGRIDFNDYMRDMGTMAYHVGNLPPPAVHRVIHLPVHYAEPGNERKRVGGEVREWQLWWLLNHRAFRAAQNCWAPEHKALAGDLPLVARTGLDRIEIAMLQRDLMKHLLGEHGELGQLLEGVDLEPGSLAFINDLSSDLRQSLYKLAIGTTTESHIDRRLRRALSTLGLRLVSDNTVLKESVSGVWSLLALRNKREEAVRAEQLATLKRIDALTYGTPDFWGGKDNYEDAKLQLIAAGRDGRITIPIWRWKLDGEGDIPMKKRKNYRALVARFKRQAKGTFACQYDATLTPTEIVLTRKVASPLMDLIEAPTPAPCGAG